ncbi:MULTISPECIES: nitroreductase family protein [Niastella]|uniref:Nitroreductase family protein n=1 Tax=Niastella soli TaxID=2821487 RepID=A0ABS3Z2A7_9BACT|nr:nitroreductase family protein [Niastella soli]MBO9203815.1 nitroreductase family protein [Niastella soli]
MALLNDLMWRYATKKMNGQTIPKDKLDYILEAARLAPSSSGLQPYQVFVITNKSLLSQIRGFSNDQSQITDCSHLLVFAAWDSYSYERIGDVFLRTVKERGLTENAKDAYHKRIWDIYEPLGRKWQSEHSAKQAYIALGLAVAAAAEQKIDSTPMEGFDKDKMDELLRLEKLGLKSVVILPIGYRDEDHDWLLNLKKVRTPKEEFITEL